MGPEELSEERWQRIRQAFLRAPAPPSSLETEAFVAKVMARLEPAQAPWWEAGTRWLVPAMSFALAASALFILRPNRDFSEPADALLLMRGETSGLTRLMSQQDHSTADDLLALTMEE